MRNEENNMSKTQDIDAARQGRLDAFYKTHIWTNVVRIVHTSRKNTILGILLFLAGFLAIGALGLLVMRFAF